jgi:hypothetical protein
MIICFVWLFLFLVGPKTLSGAQSSIVSSSIIIDNNEKGNQKSGEGRQKDHLQDGGLYVYRFFLNNN